MKRCAKAHLFLFAGRKLHWLFSAQHAFDPEIVSVKPENRDLLEPRCNCDCTIERSC
jgi:hypothetical protein